MSRILIVGAKGFAKELLEIVLQRDSDVEASFYDDISDDLPERLFGTYPIFRSEAEASAYLKETDSSFALGVGNPDLRAKLAEKFVGLGGRLTTLISPFAKIGAVGNLVGNGVCVLTDAVIESSNILGEGALIHVGALISHDVTIGNFCEISPRASLLGNTSIGNFCSLGTACVVLPNVKIGDRVVVGAGAVVTKDVADGLTVAGVPARPLVK
jgi:sugar O-acyltransferase (sialic acid O-acetyltransferase NeuD family)